MNNTINDCVVCLTLVDMTLVLSYKLSIQNTKYGGGENEMRHLVTNR